MNKGKIKHLLTKWGGVVYTLAFMSIVANAQTIDSTLALKMACETSLNNTVTIGYPAKISNGAGPALPEIVNTPCTIVLAPSGSLETDQIGMRFNGGLIIRSTAQTHAHFVKSYFSAPAITLSLRGDGSSVGVDESLLQATAGNLVVSLGNGGVIASTLPLSGALASFEAAGAVNLNGGTKFEATLTDTQITAGNGINVNMNGQEGIFKAEKSNLINNGGAISIRSNSPKALVELSFGDVRSANGIVVALQQTESDVNVVNARLFGGAGNINLNVAPNGFVGKVEVNDSVLDTNGAVNISASINTQKGMSKVQKSSVRAGGAATVRTGPFGETLVLESGFNSATSIVFSTGAGGTCVNQGNNLVAPVIRPCN